MMPEREPLARTFAALQLAAPAESRRGPQLSAALGIALLVLTVWLLTLAGAGWNVWHGRIDKLHEARTTVSNLATLLAQDMRGRLQAWDMLVLGVVERLESEGLTEPVRAQLRLRFMEFEKGSPGPHMIGVVDAAGGFAISNDPERGRTLNVRTRDFFAYLAGHPQGGRFVSMPFVSRFDNRWVIAVARRWNRPDGAFGGVVIATIDLAEMEQSYRPLNLGTQGAAALWAPPGSLVARIPPAPDKVGRDDPAAYTAVRQALSDGAGIAIFHAAADGIDRLYAYRRVEGSELVQFVGLSLNEVLAAWHREVRKTLAVAIGVVLVTGFLGIHLIRIIVRRGEERAAYRMLAENATDMILCLDTRFIRRYVSPACREILGYAPEELLGKSPLEVSHPDDLLQMRTAFEAVLGGAERRSTNNRIRHKDGSWVWVDVQLRRIVSARGQTIGIIGALRDATARQAAEQALQNANRHLAALAKSDGLTGLANRRHFDEVLEQEMRRAHRTGAPLALILLDVDRFKSFNDRYGHPAGDCCLRRIADAVLAALQRPSDLAARYGGEELAVILPDTVTAGARRVAERIELAVRAAAIAHADGVGGIVTVSIGIAVMLDPPGSDRNCVADEAALVTAADRALYAAKSAGRARIEVAKEAA